MINKKAGFWNLDWFYALTFQETDNFNFGAFFQNTMYQFKTFSCDLVTLLSWCHHIFGTFMILGLYLKTSQRHLFKLWPYGWLLGSKWMIQKARDMVITSMWYNHRISWESLIFLKNLWRQRWINIRTLLQRIFHPIVPDKSTGPPPLQPPREAMLLAELI